MGLIPVSGRFPEKGNGNPFQYSCLVNSMDRGACGLQFSSVQFSHSLMSDSLQPHGLQHTRLPCPSPTPGAYSNSCPSSRWCHQTISSSVVLFFSHRQSFPASGSFQMSPLHQVAKALDFHLQHQSFQWMFWTGFPLGWIGWISLQSKGLSRVFSNTTLQKHIHNGVLLSH